MSCDCDTDGADEQYSAHSTNVLVTIQGVVFQPVWIPFEQSTPASGEMSNDVVKNDRKTAFGAAKHRDKSHQTD